MTIVEIVEGLDELELGTGLTVKVGEIMGLILVVMLTVSVIVVVPAVMVA